MPACGACGAQAPDAARFCPACGARLAPAAAPESRRRVTVLFSDLAGSTQLGEQLDPEVLRRVMARYFEEMRAVIERHGGIVEKFIGDAVTAVFGVPARREDDALRAIRAALDMRASQERLNDELQERFGVRLRVRTGVNTGEVVAGDPGLGQAFVVGDAVNVAARLEQAAPEGEILVGAETERLVRDDVVLEPVPALELKGKRERVPAFRLADRKRRRGARRRSRWSAASGSWRPCTRRSRAAPSAGAASW
jgi:class 3 adenylate cyclase